MSNTIIDNKDSNFYKILDDSYKLLIELGSGSFGVVYKVLERRTNKEYAVKIEDKNSKSRLKNEYKIYKKLREEGITFGIPKIKCYWESEKKCYLFMQLLGSSLDKILNDLPGPFDLATVLKLGIQITKLLEMIHNAGYLHRDIKPNNFLIGKDKDIDIVYIMDFGLSKKYINDDGEHIKMRVERSLVGTARYASINVHQGLEPSRRDDLESVGYMLVYFLLKKLPWQGLKKKKDTDHIKLIGDYKMKISVEELCQNVPSCFKEYIKYCRSLKFDETPNYNYLKNLLIKTAKEKKVSSKYLWENEFEL